MLLARRSALVMAVVLGVSGSACSIQEIAPPPTYAPAEVEVVAFEEPPPLVEVDSNVWIVEDSDFAIYYVDGYYWCERGGVWFYADYWDSPWVSVEVELIPIWIRHRDHWRDEHYHPDWDARRWREPRDHDHHHDHDHDHPPAHAPHHGDAPRFNPPTTQRLRVHPATPTPSTEPEKRNPPAEHPVTAPEKPSVHEPDAAPPTPPNGVPAPRKRAPTVVPQPRPKPRPANKVRLVPRRGAAMDTVPDDEIVGSEELHQSS